MARQLAVMNQLMEMIERAGRERALLGLVFNQQQETMSRADLTLALEWAAGQPSPVELAGARQRVRSEPGWTVHELATGHDPMVSAPGALADILLEAARDA